MASTPNRVQTKAWTAFEANLDMITHLSHFAIREALSTKAAIARIGKSVDRVRVSVADDPKARASKRVVAILKNATRYAGKVHEYAARMATVMQWEVVVLVTCVEAYLQDVLESAAEADKALMKKSEQTATYQEITAAASLDELATELRRRWVKNWLGDGGPARWISRLKRMGAKAYPDELSPLLERIWGIRHAQVHAAGRATAELLKRHPGVAANVGDRVKVTPEQFQTFVKGTTDFVESTERYFLARYPSLGIIPSADKTSGAVRPTTARGKRS